MPAQIVEQLGLGFIAQPLEVSLEVGRGQGGAEPLDPLVVQEVFHPGMLTDLPIPMVPLQRQDSLHDVEHISGVHVTQGISGARERLLFVVGPPHTTAHVDIAATQFAGGIRERHQADVLRQEVD